MFFSFEGKLDLYNIETGLIMCNLNSDSIVHNQSQLLNEQKLGKYSADCFIDFLIRE